MSELPEYTVRTSTRARRVSLRVTSSGQVEVVAPVGTDPRWVARLVRDKRDWIAHQQSRAAQRMAALAAEPLLPQVIALRAVGETWHVEYRNTDGDGVVLSSRPSRRLLIGGAVGDVALCQRALRAWLARTARDRLGPWLARLGREQGLVYRRLAIRNQVSRWGSYSSRGTISLNCRLLFLPPELVTSVMLHELCHSLEMNHSAAFWAVLTARDPAARQSRAALRSAWRYLPRWVQDDSGPTEA